MIDSQAAVDGALSEFLHSCFAYISIMAELQIQPWYATALLPTQSRFKSKIA